MLSLGIDSGNSDSELPPASNVLTLDYQSDQSSHQQHSAFQMITCLARTCHKYYIIYLELSSNKLQRFFCRRSMDRSHRPAIGHKIPLQVGDATIIRARMYFSLDDFEQDGGVICQVRPRDISRQDLQDKLRICIRNNNPTYLKHDTTKGVHVTVRACRGRFFSRKKFGSCPSQCAWMTAHIHEVRHAGQFF
jgi:hypothetical protein